MNIEIVAQNTTTGKAFDISDIVSKITIEWFIEENPGKLELTINNLFNENYISEGSPISIKIDSKKIFWGFVFKLSKNRKQEMQIIAYDQLRYLKSKDTYVFSNMSCSDIFKRVCQDYNLNHKLVATSILKLPQRINDNKTLAEIIQFSLDQCLIGTGRWLFMRDNFGTLELLDVAEEKTTLCIGDESLLTDYNYESSIEDSYNQVKLIKENKEKKKREIYIVKDSSNIKKWGLLQFSEKVNEKMNDAQIKEKAENTLKSKNKVKKNIKLTAIGDFRVKAGTGVVLQIKDLENDIPYNKYVIVTKVSHKIDNCKHLMDLEVRFE